MTTARSRILDAAIAIHRAGGIDALSLRAVASAVGVTPMALYRHFRDKDALIDALVGHGYTIWESYLARASRARVPLRRIERGLVQYAEFALDEPRLFEVMFLVPRRNIPAAPASLASTPSPAFGAMIAAVVEAMKQGEIANADPADTILLLWATAHGLIALHFSGRFGGNDRAFRTIFLRIVRQALAAMKA